MSGGRQSGLPVLRDLTMRTGALIVHLSSYGNDHDPYHESARRPDADDGPHGAGRRGVGRCCRGNHRNYPNYYGKRSGTALGTSTSTTTFNPGAEKAAG